jgi:hypothetical protein
MCAAAYSGFGALFIIKYKKYMLCFDEKWKYKDA